MAGLLYVLLVLTGMFVLLYLPGRLFVRGDATAARILAHQTLYRSWTAMGLLSESLHRPARGRRRGSREAASRAG